MLSFIIPAHDEERLIGATLAAIQSSAQALGESCEVLVVDDASTDRTAAISSEHGARVIRVDHRHIAATRNVGAREATGQWLFFIDADTLINADYLRAAIHALRSGAAGGGAAVRLSGRISRSERVLQWMLIHIFRWTGVTPGCSLFCTRSAFDAVGGFDETYFAGEDVAMGRALARYGRLVILKQAVLTSARKLRTHSAAEQLRLAARFVWRGRAMLRSRDALGLWYGKRRDEP